MSRSKSSSIELSAATSSLRKDGQMLLLVIMRHLATTLVQTRSQRVEKMECRGMRERRSRERPSIRPSFSKLLSI